MGTAMESFSLGASLVVVFTDGGNKSTGALQGTADDIESIGAALIESAQKHRAYLDRLDGLAEDIGPRGDHVGC